MLCPGWQLRKFGGLLVFLAAWREKSLFDFEFEELPVKLY
jgi:hypothetical protein